MLTPIVSDRVPEDMGIATVSREIRARRLSPSELLRASLARIDALEDRLHAWVILDRGGAEETARRLDAEIESGRWRGPLHGIPVAIKDIFYTRGLSTGAGSEILADFVPDYDATTVARLRQAGAIILGKTTTSPFALTDPTETRNPWNVEHTPGGSSAGSAVAVASRMCPLALGSQTGGSTGRPASFCGIVGLKPSYGRVSVHGVIPVSFSLDHVGIFARSVEDAAFALEVIAGADPADPLCAERPVPAYAEGVSNVPEETPRVGMVRSFFLERADESLREATEHAAELFRQDGAKVAEVELPTSFDEIEEMYLTIVCAEVAAHHADLFDPHADSYAPGIRAAIERGRALRAVDYANARRHQLQLRAEIGELFRDFDVLLTPGSVTAAPADRSTTGAPTLNVPWSYSGLPTIVLPASLSAAGLPIGVQLTGSLFGESSLLRAARWCEARLGFDQAPAVR